MKTRILFGFVLPLFLISPVSAKLQLPAVLGDHMVLQQKMPLAVWGWADAGQTVTVSIAGKSATATADANGKWKTSLPALKAGGPYDMVVNNGSDAVTIQDVLVGEVWIGSGQSNMEFALRSTNDAETEIPKADFPKIRLFTVDRTTSFEPKEDLPGSWKVCTPDTAKDFSAVAYHFGKGIHQALKVPVGLIASDWGGTPGEAWTPRPAMDENPAFKDLLSLWDHDESQIMTWRKGYKFDMALSDIQLVPAGKNGKAMPIHVEKSGKDFGGEWNLTVKPGASKATYSMEGKGFTGGPAGLFTGLMEGGSWGGITAPLSNNQPQDLTKYETVEFYAKGHGKYGMSLGQASITDYDYYNSGSFDLTPEWKLYRFPIKDMKQGGWGAPKPFTPDQILSIAFNVQPPYWPDMASIVYNGMMAPLTPFKIRGVIWYQGESNVGRASQYHELLSTLIKGWRETWGEGDFPFLIIQLPNYLQVKPDPSESDWAKLREAQLQTLDVPNTGLITTIDLGDANNIHPKDKTDVGKRATLAGLKLAYHKKVVGSGPLFASAVVKGSKMVVKFKEVGTGLTAKGVPVTGFALAGSDRVFHWAEAKIGKGGTVVVSSLDVKEPVEVRYAWADNPICNLYNKEGLPASPFRYSTQPIAEKPATPAVAPGKALIPKEGKVLIDDFELGKPQNLLGGLWQVEFDDHQLGTILKDKDQFIVKGGADNSKYCGRIYGHFGKNQAPWPFASLYTSLDPTDPVDLSGFKSIEFWAKGDGKTYDVLVYLSQVTDYAHYRHSFTAPKEWTKVSLDLSTFYQPDWGAKVPQDYHSVKEILFAPSGMNDEDFDLSIDDVTLVK